MDDIMDASFKSIGQIMSQQDCQGVGGKRKERDAIEWQFKKDKRAQRQNYTKSIQECLGGGDQKERDKEFKQHKSHLHLSMDKDKHHNPPSQRSPPYKRRRKIAFVGSRKRRFEDGSGEGFTNNNRVRGSDEVGLYLSKTIEDQNKLNYTKFQGFSMNSLTSIAYGGSCNLQKEVLMTYKHFILGLEDDISPKEAQCRYEAYKTKHITRRKRAYFKKYKDSDWMREKYDPTKLGALSVRRNENAKMQAKIFLAKLQTSFLCLDSNMELSINKGYDSDMNYKIKRMKLFQEHSLIQEYDDSFPIHFQCPNLKRVLKDIDLERSLIKKLDIEKGIEENLLLVDKDIEVDMIVGSPMVTLKYSKHVRRLEAIEFLEMMRTYLWCVHFIDYYGMIEYKEKPKKNWLKSAPNAKSNNSNTKDDFIGEWEKKLETTWQTRLQTSDVISNMFGKEMLQITTNEALDPFVCKIQDEKYGWKYGCSVSGCTKLFHGAEFVHKHLNLKHFDLVNEINMKAQEKLYFQNYMSDVDSPGANHKASMCWPRVHNMNYTIQNIHQNRLFHNCSKMSTTCNDKQKFVDKEVSNEKLHPLIDAECSMHPIDQYTKIIENKHFICGKQKEQSQLDALEAPQHSLSPHLFPCLQNTRPSLFQRRHIESHFGNLPINHFIFDHFNSQPLQHVSSNSYMHDGPCQPQVLMPIFGAGPLGPFVQAPSRLAMRYIIKGNDPFHCDFEHEAFNRNEGQFRNLKIPTPNPLSKSELLNVSSLMIPPHVLHQDPRSIRSYHDLDKLDDGETLIDYRSL